MQRWFFLSACLSLAGLASLTTGCVPRAAKANAPVPNPPNSPLRLERPAYEVESKTDITYFEGEEADKAKHRLDLYLPKDVTDYPVFVFIHGGAWIFGSKDDFGIYSKFGKMLASHGVGTVVINYRLSPKVKHPEHIKDVARAFAWTHANIKKYGGRPDQMYVCGQSAGGHLAALLATDESYLKAEGLSLKDIKGALPISGVYTLLPGLFEDVFGKDPEARKQAFPLTHVKSECPPFLIIYGDHDFPACDIGSEAFCKALKEKNVAAETQVIAKRNHIDIISRCGDEGDPCGRALLEFIAKSLSQ